MSKDVESAARFEKFCKMRLAGLNDTVYRNYDLLTKQRMPKNVVHYLHCAGQYVPHSGPLEPLTTLQARFMRWGYGVKTLGEIETLLHEFWVYQRIRWYGKKNWPYRTDAEITRLYNEHEAALKVTESGKT